MRCHLRLLCTTSIFVLVLGFGVNGFALDNLVPDPGFDNPAMPAWPPSTSTYQTWAWDSRDIDDDASSGSGNLTNLWDSLSMYTVLKLQCIDNVSDADQWNVGVWLYWPNTKTTLVGDFKGYVQIVQYDEPGCSSPIGNSQTDKIVVNSNPNEWLLSSATNMTLAPGTESVGFGVTITKIDSAAAVEILFDDAYLYSTSIFKDDFETNSTSEWSASNP